MKTQSSAIITTQVAIVGAGPAGIMLGYLLAMKGVEVTLIEAQKDFDREFRGDTLHPTTLETIESLGLIDELKKLPHTLLKKPLLHLPQGVFQLGDFGILRSKYPYIMLMPQRIFLNFMAEKASLFPSFRLMMQTKAEELIIKKGKVVGVRCLSGGKEQTIEAELVIGADGRFSTVRQQLGKIVREKEVPVDILWFRLPKQKGDKASGIGAFIDNGHFLIELERHDHWQVGYMLKKGSFAAFKKKGLENFRSEVSRLDGSLEKKMKQIKNWNQVGFLPIQCGQVDKWYEDGALLIGDAAHVMSPVGGVGINYAIQDAVVAGNVLSSAILKNELSIKHLALVQHKRKWPTRVILWFQNFAHKRIIKTIINPSITPSVPFFFKWQWVRNIVLRFIATGLWRVKVEKE